MLGWDISGVVEEVVFGVRRFRPGDEVYGMPSFPRAANAYAEFVAAPSRQLASKAATLDHAPAAALPFAGLTAWQALVDAAHVEAGQTVLIHGAGGGVGHLVDNQELSVHVDGPSCSKRRQRPTSLSKAAT